MSYHEEEAHYHFTMMAFKELHEDYGDRVWADLEKNSPNVYESICAYKANKDVEEFLSNQSETRWKEDCDYWKESND